MEEERTGLGGGFDERGTVEYKTPPREESDDEFDDLGRKKKKYKMPYKKPMIAQSVPDPPSEPEEEEEEEEDDDDDDDDDDDNDDDDDDDDYKPALRERATENSNKDKPVVKIINPPEKAKLQQNNKKIKSKSCVIL